MEQDLVEAQLSQAALSESQPQALSLSKKLKLAAKGTGSTTSGCINLCCRRRRRARSESRTSQSPATGPRRSDEDEWELNDIEAGRVGQPPDRGRERGHAHATSAGSEQPKPSTSKKV